MSKTEKAGKDTRKVTRANKEDSFKQTVDSFTLNNITSHGPFVEYRTFVKSVCERHNYWRSTIPAKRPRSLSSNCLGPGVIDCNLFQPERNTINNITISDRLVDIRGALLGREKTLGRMQDLLALNFFFTSGLVSEHFRRTL